MRITTPSSWPTYATLRTVMYRSRSPGTWSCSCAADTHRGSRSLRREIDRLAVAQEAKVLGQPCLVRALLQSHDGFPVMTKGRVVNGQHEAWRNALSELDGFRSVHGAEAESSIP